MRKVFYNRNMKQFSLIIFVAIFSINLSAFSDPTIYYLKNGTTVAIVNDPAATVVSSYVFVRTGSIFEGDWIGSGVSHYLEHLLAGGTTSKKSEDEYRNIIDGLGGAYNAYTTYDHTAYYIHSSAKNVSVALETLFEWMYYGRWTNQEFKREKGVIL